MILDDFRCFYRFKYGVFSKACKYPHCLRSLEWQVVSSLYSGTHTKSVPPCLAENRARCTVPGGLQATPPADPREIMAQSSTSYLFIPFPSPDRECVIILKRPFD